MNKIEKQMEWVEALKKEIELVAAEYRELSERGASLSHRLAQIERELYLLNNLIEYHGEEKVEISLKERL